MRVFCGYWPDCSCRRKCRYHTKRYQFISDFKLMLEVMAIKFWKG